MTVEPFSGSAAEWNRFVRAQPEWSHFHLYGWREVMERTLGHECRYTVLRGPDGAVRGVLPLVRVRSLIFGHYLVSMPFLNYGGPLGDSEAVTALAGEAVEGAERDGVKLLELRCRGEAPLGIAVSHRKVTVLLDLPPDSAEPLWQGLPAKVRSQVRRPQKEGVEVRFGPDQLEPFYRVFARHMRDLGTPVLGKSVFTGMAEVFPDDVWFGCAYLGGEPVAGGAGFRWRDEFEMTWASSLREYNSIAPNMLLYWSFMERCVAHGIATFNFGRCTPGSGTHRFKRQWGGRDEQLWWYQWGPEAGEGTPSPDGGRFSWGPRVWRHLPLPVANWIGPGIVRLIP